MKIGKTWMARLLAGTMAVAMLTTSALATGVDIVVPVGEGFDVAKKFDHKDIAAVKDPGATGYRFVTVENGKLVPVESDNEVSSNLYAVKDAAGKWGYNENQDGTGAMVIPAVYDELPIEELRDWFDLYVAKEAGVWGIYNRDTTNCGVTGITNATYDRDMLYDSVKVQGVDGKWGLVWLQHWEEQPYLTLPMTYDDIMGEDNLSNVDINGSAYWVKNGTSASVVGNKWTEEGDVFSTFFTMDAKYYQPRKDAEGNWHEGTRFDQDDQLVIHDTTVEGSKYGVIGMDGTMVVDFIYDEISSIGMGMYAPRNFGEVSNCAMMAHDGTLITDFIFGNLNKFNELGVISGCLESDYEAYALISKTGTPITQYAYQWINDCGEGMWAARNTEGMNAVLTSDGKLLTQFVYSDLGRYQKGLLPAIRAEKFGMLNTMGDEVLPCSYDTLGQFDKNDKDDKNPYDCGYYDFNWIGQLDATGAMKLGVIQNNYDITVEQQTTKLVVNGVEKTVGAYATKDAAGNLTNYFKLRDIASLLNGTTAQFKVDWYGQVAIEVGQAYVANGTEMAVPFTGTQVGDDDNAATIVNGRYTEMDTIVLTDAAGNGYTYYKLRDLGSAIGFNVGWDNATASITVTTP